ncbi:MAG TPA: hypothetical protein VMD48_10250 [Solirubrobacteraceae bacterium]|nr:hypothetical protein [Solirubrobacteraceae bacterium]
MARHDPGPRRSTSAKGYVWQTRIVGALAALVLVAAVVSDRLNTRFWDRHTLLADLVVSLIVVALSVAVVNEALERRQRQRWSVLAQYVLFQLVRHARVTWTELMEMIGLMPSGEETQKRLDGGAQAVHDTQRVAGALGELLADPQRRPGLHQLVDRLVDSGDELLGRWASVMLNSSAYTEIIDRHVELYGRVAWVGGLINYYEPGDDPIRLRLSRSGPAVQLQSDFDEDKLRDYLVGIIQLAEALDRGTLQLALRIVPPEWWAMRLPSTALGSAADD